MQPHRFLSTFDGLQSRTLFCLWTGDDALSNNRIQALWSIFNNTGCPIAFINRNTIVDWIKPDFPLHAAFPYLSSTHKSDYLRCYLMHHYGGGYCDIKQTSKKWAGFFEALESSDALALGYQELAHGIPHVHGALGDTIRGAHKDLIGLCAFIFKRNTPLTSEWLRETERLLDEKLPALQANPARHPLDQTGVILPDGQPSAYPLRWAELLGEVFHPLTYRYKEALLKAPIEPVFAGYR